MVDLSVFDSILDLVFVVDADGRIAYCNDTAATFCATSVKRVAGKVLLGDLMSFGEPGLLPFTTASLGRNEPTPFIETPFTVIKTAKTGKIQLSARPMGDGAHWGFFIKDVSLEETLAAKYRAELAKTEEYARNLEKLVEARTAELHAVNQTLNAILNSLGQGFFTFNAAGDCGGVFTKACEDVLEGSPKGRKAWDVLALPPGPAQAEFHQWSETLFKEYLPFDDLRPLGPSLFPHSRAKHIALDYYPIRRANKIHEVVVVATDQTAEFEAQAALEVERQFAGMIVKFTKNKEQFLSFLASAKQNLSVLDGIAQKPMHPSEINESFRVLHTLEGEAGAFSLKEMRHHARLVQAALEPAKGTPLMEADVQLNYRRALNDMAANFVVFLETNQDLFRLPEQGVSRTAEVAVDSLHQFLVELEQSPNTNRLAQDFRHLFLRVAIEDRIKYFDGLCQTVAERLGKRLKPLIIEGGDTRVFPEPYQPIFSSMVHAFRNAVDHGLETPDEREWAGKDPAGQIKVMAKTLAGRLQITIQDDGRGIDPAIIRAKLPEKFPGRDFSSASDAEIVQAVCLPGFSSREAVGEFSGRGVGLDALNEEVMRIGGRLTVSSSIGQGTKIEMDLPELEQDLSASRSA